MKNGEFDRISPTALGAAWLRAISDIPYAAEIAQEAGAERFVMQRLEKMVSATVAEVIIGAVKQYFAFSIEARFFSVSRSVKERRIKNILEVASGLSPRGLLMSEEEDVTYVETDLPEILGEKQRIVKTILDRHNTHWQHHLFFRPTNALDFGELLAAAEALTGPIAIITEGLLDYFDEKEKITAAQNFRLLLERKGGVWVTPDIKTRLEREEMVADEGMRKFVAEQVMNMTGRNLDKNAFADENAIRSFFGLAGLVSETIRQSTVFSQLASVSELKLDGRIVQETLEKRRVWILSCK